jgi:hypothetical protein
MNGICFAACKSIVPADIWIPGQRFGWRAVESQKRPVEMADTAAHLVERVLPIVPMRQWASAELILLLLLIQEFL